MSASSKKKLRKEQNAAAITEKQRKEQKEQKKLKTTTTLFVVIMAVIVVVALTVGIVGGIRNSGIIEKNTVALTVGEHEINAVELNYYYIDTVTNTYNEWTSTYGDYASYYLTMMGLDITLPLDEQAYGADGSTWADYFVDMAVEQATANYALYDRAIAEGRSLTEDDQITIDSSINMLKLYASMSQLDTDDYLQRYYGHGASEESIRKYMEVTAIASSYYTDYADSLVYDDAALRAYEADKYHNFSSYTYDCYTLSYVKFLAEDESENPTDEQVKAAAAKAKAAAESLLSATTSAELDAAIAALEINTGTSAASTKYEANLYSNVVTTIRDWVSDDARQEHDIAVIPSQSVTTDENGNEVTQELSYYVVLFHSADHNTDPMANVRHLLVQFEESEDGTVTDKMKAAAKAEADGYLATWRSGEATEESFIELVKAHSDDSSASTGGLFEDINHDSSYVHNFLHWAIDPVRQTGDAEVIETEYGYHVMYYVGDDELSYRDMLITQELTNTDIEAWYSDVIDVNVARGDLSKVDSSIILSDE